MRIAIDARSLNERSNSNRTYWAELVRALGRRSDLQLLLVSNVPLAEEDVPSNAEAVIVPSGGRWFSLAVLPRVARERKADVAHVQYSVSPLFRLPTVTTIHDVSFFVEPGWFSPKDRFLLRKTIPIACHRAAHVLAPSNSSRGEILRFIDVAPEKVLVVPLGTPTGIERRERTSPPLADGHPYALLVGGASPRKNVAGAIEAVRQARVDTPNLRLVVTGRLPENFSEPWIVAPGPLDDSALASAYRGAHALLHPSYHEGFGFTILEAMSLGCPVVCSDRGSLPEIAGEAAILCDPLDVRAMASGLRQLMNPAVRSDRIAQGRRRASVYDWDATAERTVEAYKASL